MSVIAQGSRAPSAGAIAVYVSIGSRCSGRCSSCPRSFMSVVLVGLPFLLALYYSVSAYSIFNPSLHICRVEELP